MVYCGLTPRQQPGSYQGGEIMMVKSVFWWRKPEYLEASNSPLKSILSTSTRHNSKTLTIQTYHTSNSTCSLCKNVGLINEKKIFIYEANGQYLKRGLLSKVYSMGDCHGGTQSDCRLSFPLCGHFYGFTARLTAPIGDW